MFRRLAFSICASLALISGTTPAVSGSLSNLLGLHSSSDIATKVAEFKEDSPVGGLAFSPDGSRLAVNPTFADPDVHVWHWAKRKRLGVVFHNVGPPGVGNAIQYGVDGSLLAVGHERASPQNAFEIIRVWNANDASVRSSINDADWRRKQKHRVHPGWYLFRSDAKPRWQPARQFDHSSRRQLERCLGATYVPGTADRFAHFRRTGCSVAPHKSVPVELNPSRDA